MLCRHTWEEIGGEILYLFPKCRWLVESVVWYLCFQSAALWTVNLTQSLVFV